MARSFHKTLDPVIVQLLDPARGFAMTCDLCRAHLKVEATGKHVCAGQTLRVQGVGFEREDTALYRCEVCEGSVVLSRVRAHALRHDSRLTVEEWLDFTVQPALNRSSTLPSQLSAKLAPLPSLRRKERRLSHTTLLLNCKRKWQRALFQSAVVLQRSRRAHVHSAFRTWRRTASPLLS